MNLLTKEQQQLERIRSLVAAMSTGRDIIADRLEAEQRKDEPSELQIAYINGQLDQRDLFLQALGAILEGDNWV